MTPPSENVRRELAPTGTLRAALNLGNPVLVQKSAAGTRSGVTVALATELARRLGCKLEFVEFPAAGEVVAALPEKAWDIAFLAIEPAREREVDFTAPYVLIEGTYLVRQESPFKTVTDLDQPGNRIAVGPNAAYDLFLSRTLKHATVVRAATGGGEAVIGLFLKENLEAAAGIRQPLVAHAKEDSSVRVIPGRFMEIRQAMCLPPGRLHARDYLRDFIEEMKASGFVARALAESGQAEATVAPPAA